MGEVYRARDTKLNRDVAIKVLPDLFASDAERLARFTHEAQTLASLNHPHIAAIYGLEESGDVRALVMELVEGEDLSQRIARGAIPLDEALTIAKQIAEALEAAHELGIIHRDLKPANVKVRTDGTVKVLDYGLAKAVEPTGVMSPNLSMSPTITTPAMTRAGVILGTRWSFACLFAAPFDERRLQVTGRAVPVVNGVRRGNFGNTSAKYSVSDSGSLVFVPGPVSMSDALRGVVRMNRKGGVEQLPLPPNVYSSIRVSPDGRQLAFGTDNGKEAIVWVYDLSRTSGPRRLTFGGGNRFPIWSGDGQRVVFQSDREGDPGVYWQRARRHRHGAASHDTRPGHRSHPGIVVRDRRGLLVQCGGGLECVAVDVLDVRKKGGALWRPTINRPLHF
jgi:Protein kinase domain/WD40-like Beta Propeller Repeat